MRPAARSPRQVPRTGKVVLAARVSEEPKDAPTVRGCLQSAGFTAELGDCAPLLRGSSDADPARPRGAGAVGGEFSPRGLYVASLESTPPQGGANCTGDRFFDSRVSVLDSR